VIFACEVLNYPLPEFLELDADEGIFWIEQAIAYRKRESEATKAAMKKK